jgi:FMN reductase
MFDVITIAGSPSSSSRSAAVLEYARQVISRHGIQTRALNIRDLPPEDLIYGRVDSPAILEWVTLLNQARVVIIATPVYKAAYSGVLKAFLDLLPQQVLAGKLVLPIATGGSPAHMLAIDYALRPVIAALGAQHILQGVYIIDSQVQLGNGAIQLDPTIELRLDSALQYLIDRLGSDVASTPDLHELVGRTV